MVDGLAGRDREQSESGIIELPDGVADEAQAKARRINDELSRKRRILNSDELAELVAPRARLEVHFTHLRCWFFSIDGVLAGLKVEGALFAGECILVFAETKSIAQDRANAGLRYTVELLHEEYNTRQDREVRDSILNPGMDAFVDGKRAQGGLGERSIPQQRKLAAVMADVLGFKKFER